MRDFIIEHIELHPTAIAAVTAKSFGLSRQSVNRYLDRMVAAGELQASGATRARKYGLVELYQSSFETPVSGLEEDVVWREKIEPHMAGEARNVLDILQYGATEMINNVIDHSKSERLLVHVIKNAKNIQLIIRDFGIGIFKKIADECSLADEREAILELSKGKLTTDPSRHSGEGIFFTSRMMSEFILRGGRLALIHSPARGSGDDWLIEDEDKPRPGTLVSLCLSRKAKHTVQEVFSKYEEDDEGYRRFSKTHVPVKLAIYGHEQLVSRSQARRVLSRFNRFSEVMLDFKDVPMIGQAFADEIFRVYRLEHPDIDIIPVGASPQILAMITRVMTTEDGDQLKLFVRDEKPSDESA